MFPASVPPPPRGNIEEEGGTRGWKTTSATPFCFTEGPRNYGRKMMWRKVPPPLNIVVMLSEEYALYIVVYEKEVAKTTVINEETRTYFVQ